MLSILIPTYNCKEFIEETLQYVFKHKLSNFEVIVRDDCSVDGTWEILQRLQHLFNFKLFRNETNMGMCKNWNALFNDASGTYILKVDADDIIFTDKINSGLDFLEANPEIDVLAFAFKVLEADGSERLVAVHNKLEQGIQNNLVGSVFLRNPFHLCFSIYKTDTLKKLKIGGKYFMETEIGDLDLQLRLAENDGKLYFNKEVAGYYRMHESNSSKTPLKQAKSWINDVFPAHCDYLKKHLYKETKKVLRGRLINYLKGCILHGQKIDFNYLKVSLFTYIKF